MSRRTAAGLLALGLAAVLTLVAALMPTGYVTFKPGPTVNVLGDYAGEKVIQISGRKVYQDGGQLRMLTVYQSGPDRDLDLLTVLQGWASPSTAVLPKDVVYKKQDTAATVRQQSALEMTTSQDDATAAALTAAGIKFGTEAVVSSVVEKGASDGILKPGDVILAVNGKKVAGSASVVSTVTALKPGSKVTFTIKAASGGTTKDVVVTTRPDKDDPRQSRVNVGLAGRYVFPFKVDISLGENIGGPSAGAMFALTIYDLLTPGSLTGGNTVAGTGTVTGEGVIGPIGGIGQKMFGAQDAGAKLLLVSKENWQEAIVSPYDKDKMKLACVHTIKDAIATIETWRENPSADLSRCPA